MSATQDIVIVFAPGLLDDPAQEADIRAKLADFTEVEEAEIGPLIEEEEAESFATRNFGSWAPLSPATVAEKQRLGYGGRPDLVRTGALQASLVPGMPGHIFEVGPDSVTVGISGDVIPYANRLAQGDPSRNLPARRLMALRAETVEQIVELLAEWLGGGDAIQIAAAAPVET